MIVIDKETHAQIIQRAATELAVLSAEESEHISSLVSIADELETLQQRAVNRQELLSIARATLAQAQESHVQASVQARLCEGMLAHESAQQAAKDAAATLQRIGIESSLIEVDKLAEQEQDQRLSERLIEQREHRTERLQVIGTERANYLYAQETADAAIGELEYQAIAEKLALKREQLDQVRSELAGLESEEKMIIANGVQALNNWPGWASQVRKEAPPISDDCTGTLTRFIAFIDAIFENNGAHLRALGTLPCLRNLYMGRWRDLFMLREDELWAIDNPREAPRLLTYRRNLAYQALQEYRARLR